MQEGGDDMDSDVSIVIPAFNESRRLPRTLERLSAELPGHLQGSWEIVVSDDGSTDDTAMAVLDHARAAPVRLVRSEVNRGKGAALLAGANESRYPWVLFLDADLPVPVRTIPAMLELGRTADLVLGSRCLVGASFDPPQPLGRRLGGSCFRAAVAALGYRGSSDPQCGVKLMRYQALEPVLRAVGSTRFSFDVELIELAGRRGVAMCEFPVTWSHVPGSSLRPLRDAAVTLLELIQLRTRLGRRTEPAVA
jgi:glycosyltransferase involved in cell wall biosynthesis